MTVTTVTPTKTGWDDVDDFYVLGTGPTPSRRGVPRKAGLPPAGRWPTALRAAGRTPQTIHLYVAELDRFSRWLKVQGMPVAVENLTRDHVEAYIVSLADRGLSEATISLTFRTLAVFFKWLVSREFIDTSPMAKMDRPRVHVEAKPMPSADVVEALLATCVGKGWEATRDRAIICLLRSTGMRRQELVNLRLVDVQEAPHTGTISIIGKAQVHRPVALGPATLDALDKYLRLRRKHPRAALPGLWLGVKGEMTGSGILQLLRRRGRLVGYEVPLGAHAFRHGFAHEAMAAGMSDGDLMQIAGWTSPAMLRRYGASLKAERAITAHHKLLEGKGW